MKRTQIQLPDELHAAAYQVANQKEISLAELVRRGLEYMIAVSPGAPNRGDEWALPPSRALGGCDPFEHATWREDIHTSRLRAAESGPRYGQGDAE